MNPLTIHALDRTLLLMRDEISPAASDTDLLAALVGTRVALVANNQNLQTHSAQSAYVAAALLLARSGHRVSLVAPDVFLVGPQPPLTKSHLISALDEAGQDLIPGVSFDTGDLEGPFDLVVTFGSTTSRLRSRRTIAVSATDWSASIGSEPAALWPQRRLPFGALAAAAIVASEAFKISMRKLRRFARSASRFDEMFAPSKPFIFRLAPENSRASLDLGDVDVISAGAISNAALFVAARVEGITGSLRVVDFDLAEISNLNRYCLLLRSMLDRPKAQALAAMSLGSIHLSGVQGRFTFDNNPLGCLAPLVVVGVDHIPTRWDAQRANRGWLTVGATTHWSAMASFHGPGDACAGCLHPVDDPDVARIPTVAFVSFWAGLLAASYLVRKAAQEQLALSEQQTYFTPLRPESLWRTPVAVHRHCPVCFQSQGTNAA
jgi:molybdopterin/thiamine biosynthesis adenylyltransferase